MRFPARSALIIILTACAAFVAHAQSAPNATGSVSGRVTLAGEAAPGVSVAITKQDVPGRNTKAIRATTDAEGRYKLSGVAPGTYGVLVLARGFAISHDANGEPGKGVTLEASEELTGVDFKLERGAVITGRVTNADNKPVIAEQIILMRKDAPGRQYFQPSDWQMLHTDDRGIYRLYGVPAGRYTVSVGKEEGRASMIWGGGSFVRTFHPEAVEEAKAAVVEVAAGEERTGIDIKVGRALKTYEVSGRVINSETNKPVSEGYVGVSAIGDDGKASEYIVGGVPLSARGEFSIPNVLPGSYVALTHSRGASDTYGEPTKFEVIDANVGGVEIKVRSGASVSGTIVIEGAHNVAAQSQLSKLKLGAVVRATDALAPNYSGGDVGADGGFRVGGLRAGKVRFWFQNHPPVEGFSLLRVERDGVPQPEGVEIKQDEHISGVRIIVLYGQSVIRGRVRIVGGALPEGANLSVSVRPVGAAHDTHGGGVIGDQHRFRIEGMAAGEYELTLHMHPPPSVASVAPRSQQRVRQRVTVPDTGEVEVTITLNLANPPLEENRP